MASASSESPGEVPPYTYIPGATPHPVSDPCGHSFGKAAPGTASFSFDAWERCNAYVHGCLLFDQGFYWEAHETWEAAWKLARAGSPEAMFLQGLIKWGAAGVQWRAGKLTGADRHLRRSAELLGAAWEQRHRPDDLGGLDAKGLLAMVTRAYEQGLPRTPAADGRPAPIWRLPCRLPDADG